MSPHRLFRSPTAGAASLRSARPLLHHRRHRCGLGVARLEDRTLLSGTAGDVLAGIAPDRAGHPHDRHARRGRRRLLPDRPDHRREAGGAGPRRGRHHAALAAERPGPGAHAERRPVARQPRRPDRPGRPGGARVPRGGKPRRRGHLHLDDLFDASHDTVSADSDFRWPQSDSPSWRATSPATAGPTWPSPTTAPTTCRCCWATATAPSRPR